MARLTPVSPTGERSEAELVERLSALPWVRPRTGDRPRGLHPGVHLRGAGLTAAEIVIEGRE